MKDCKKIIGTIVCSNMDGCAIMENETVPNGELGKIAGMISSLTTDQLLYYLTLFGRNGTYSKICKANKIIYKCIINALEAKAK